MGWLKVALRSNTTSLVVVYIMFQIVCVMSRQQIYMKEAVRKIENGKYVHEKICTNPSIDVTELKEHIKVCSEAKEHKDIDVGTYVQLKQVENFSLCAWSPCGDIIMSATDYSIFAWKKLTDTWINMIACILFTVVVSFYLLAELKVASNKNSSKVMDYFDQTRKKL